MVQGATEDGFSRRGVLALAALCAGGTVIPSAVARAEADDESPKLVEQLLGQAPTVSDRVRLTMPKTFPNGYTVPLDLDVESPMTASDHVRQIRVLAPHNPIVEVATFHFVPGGSKPRISTRVRLAEPQFVLAAAEMSDGSVLMAKTWVDVASNGCK